jgi:hypothetical protein
MFVEAVYALQHDQERTDPFSHSESWSSYQRRVLPLRLKVEEYISDVAGNARLPESVSGKPGRRQMYFQD